MAPTFSPSASPSTLRPTQTLPPSPVPPPGPDPIQPVAVNVVFETEVFPAGQQRRLAGAAQYSRALQLQQLQQQLPNADADSCFQACLRTVSPMRFFNLYYNATGGLVCSCVQDFTGTRTVATGIVYAACLTSQELSLRGKAKPERTKAGKATVYGVAVRNTQDRRTGQAATGLTLAVFAPPRAQVSVSGTKVKPFPVRSDPQNRRTKVQPTIDNAENVVRWQNFSLKPQGHRVFMVAVRLTHGLAPGTQLPFSAAVYQTAPSNSLPFCAQWVPNNSTVRLRCGFGLGDGGSLGRK